MRHPAGAAGRRSGAAFRAALAAQLVGTVAAAAQAAADAGEDWGLTAGSSDWAPAAADMQLAALEPAAHARTGRTGATGTGGQVKVDLDHLPAATDNALAKDRARYAAELKRNPALARKVMRIAANEQGSNPRGTQSVIESMMNRASARGTSLATQARWHESEGGYYQQGNMGRGALENPRQRAILTRALRNALAGSNISNYATDNASGGFAARERRSGKFTFQSTYGGETFFSPGWGGGRSGPASRRAYAIWRRRLAGEHPAAVGHVGHANYMRGPLPGPHDLTRVTTPGGKSVVVNRRSAPAFRGFLTDLEKAGAPLDSIGGYNRRRVAGSGRWSQHAYGNAIDIDQYGRDVVSRRLRRWSATHAHELRNALNRWGMISGGDWRNPDFGHFEWGGARPWENKTAAEKSK